jgi:hypothetical protein
MLREMMVRGALESRSPKTKEADFLNGEEVEESKEDTGDVKILRSAVEFIKKHP